MTTREAQDTIIRGAGLLVTTYRPHSVRLIRLAAQVWPTGGSQMLTLPRKLRAQLQADLKERYRAEYGFSPVVLLILGALVNALIQWYFSDPETHQRLLERMRVEAEPLQTAALSPSGKGPG